jgi:glycosyltransferase involved in cell wall biosynthesis
MELNVSVVMPAKNESGSVPSLIKKLLAVPGLKEIIIVDDGSTDGTGDIAEKLGATVVRHPYSKGNGAAIKSGARAAISDVIVFMDADGQHPPEEIPRLLELLDEGYDMVVGARSAKSQASLGRWAANGIYNKLASWMVGHRVKDLTSGFRAVKRQLFVEFLHLLPNGFSYPTTSTMAFFRAGYSVKYLSFTAKQREGKSHIKLHKDGLRFLIIIFKIGTLYAPLKIFLPMAVLQMFIGLAYYLYSYSLFGRLSLVTIFLLTSGVTVFLIGLVSEQITQLTYKPSSSERRKSDFSE